MDYTVLSYLCVGNECHHRSRKNFLEEYPEEYKVETWVVHRDRGLYAKHDNIHICNSVKLSF